MSKSINKLGQFLLFLQQLPSQLFLLQLQLNNNVCVCFLCNKTTKMNPFYSLIPGQLGRATYQIYRRNKVLYSHHYQCGWLLFINLLQLESAGYSLSPMLLQSIKLVWTMCLLKIQSSLHKYKFVKYGLQDCPGALTECQNARRNRCDILAIYVVSWK